MEESKELQTAYKIFRSLIYVSVVLEFFMFALDSQTQTFGMESLVIFTDE